MSLKRLQRIIENASPHVRPTRGHPSQPLLVEARVIIRNNELAVGIEVLRDGKMQHIPGVATHMGGDPFSGTSRNIDELCEGLIEDLAEQAIKDALDDVTKPKKRSR